MRNSPNRRMFGSVPDKNLDVEFCACVAHSSRRIRNPMSTRIDLDALFSIEESTSLRIWFVQFRLIRLFCDSILCFNFVLVSTILLNLHKSVSNLFGTYRYFVERLGSKIFMISRRCEFNNYGLSLSSSSF